MKYIYFGTVFSAMIVFLLTSVLLFLRRKEGERSRTMLAFMNLLSVYNYLNNVVDFEPNYSPFVVMSVPVLLLGIFIITTYILYPIEVISPGWLNWMRVLKIYIPVFLLVLFYRVTLFFGVVYTSFRSLHELMENIGSFEVIFRLILVLLLFAPAVLLYYVPYTLRYNNTDYKWMRGYVSVVVINVIAFMVAINSNNIFVRTIYYSVSLSCSLYIVYQELFVRLIRNAHTKNSSEVIITAEDIFYKPSGSEEKDIEDKESEVSPKSSALFDRLENYLNTTQEWCDPDLSMSKLTEVLGTNRTSLREAIQQGGYAGYISYINGKRIDEFIKIINTQGESNYMETFFDVGFRNKSTALRNFKEITGMTPSDYFHRKTL